MARHVPFTEMWDLILKNHTSNVAIFPPELLIAMFWEESAFRNFRQDWACRDARHNPDPQQPCAFGFGQVVPRWAVHSALQGKTAAQRAAMILADNNLSVQVTSTTLAHAWQQQGHRIAALNQYASGSGDSRVAIPRVNSWLPCERGLLALPGGLPRSGSSPRFRDPTFVNQIKAVLRPLNIGRGFSPDLVFPETAPPASPRVGP